jgi:hypothetical protein
MPDAAPDDLVRAYLATLDEHLPGRVTGVYGYGSLALDDWRPGISDLDLLVLTEGALGAAELDTLAAVHAALPAAPQLDVVYGPRSWLAGPELPDDERAAPHHLAGTLHRDTPCGQLTPVLWLTLARYGRVFRGGPLELAVDPGRVRDYNLDNLRGYWHREAQWPAALLADADPTGEVPAEPVLWLVLGPPRLHFTLATGDVISKTGAGGYLAAQFPHWAELAGRAVAHRAGEHVTFTVADALAAGAAADAVITDATHRWG